MGRSAAALAVASRLRFLPLLAAQKEASLFGILPDHLFAIFGMIDFSFGALLLLLGPFFCYPLEFVL